MAAASGKYIRAADVINRLTPTTYIAIYDDSNNNSVSNVNDAAVQLDIDSAEGEVDSYLISENTLPLPTTTNPAIDRLVKLAALDFAESFAFRRHPDYVRTFGENPRAEGAYEMATARMKRIRTAIQQLPDVGAQTGKPANVGGLVIDDGPRTITQSADGTDNGSGF